jgi:hypothetical protein
MLFVAEKWAIPNGSIVGTPFEIGHLTGRRSSGCNLRLNVPSAKALPRMQLVMRPTAQPDIVDPRIAQRCPRLNVVELEQRAGVTSSPIWRYE